MSRKKATDGVITRRYEDRQLPCALTDREVDLRRMRAGDLYCEMVDLQARVKTLGHQKAALTDKVLALKNAVCFGKERVSDGGGDTRTVELDADTRDERRRQAGDVNLQIADVEEQTTELAEQIGERKKRLRELNTEIRTQAEVRKVECEWRVDLELNRDILWRLDLDEEVERAPIEKKAVQVTVADLEERARREQAERDQHVEQVAEAAIEGAAARAAAELAQTPQGPGRVLQFPQDAGETDRPVDEQVGAADTGTGMPEFDGADAPLRQVIWQFEHATTAQQVRDVEIPTDWPQEWTQEARRAWADAKTRTKGRR